MYVHELDAAIEIAWANLKPRLEKDPDELHRRLARRRTRAMTSPPRPWCLAIRASNHRIKPVTARLERSTILHRSDNLPIAHNVIPDPALVCELTCPRMTDSPPPP